MYGKRTKRFRVPAQVNADPELVRFMELDAAINHRSPGQEVIHLLGLALEHAKYCEGNALLGTLAHGHAQMHTPKILLKQAGPEADEEKIA